MTPIKKKKSIRCWLGWHKWKWKLLGVKYKLNAAPPLYARCERCNIKYKEHIGWTP